MGQLCCCLDTPKHPSIQSINADPIQMTASPNSASDRARWGDWRSNNWDHDRTSSASVSGTSTPTKRFNNLNGTAATSPIQLLKQSLLDNNHQPDSDNDTDNSNILYSAKHRAELQWEQLHNNNSNELTPSEQLHINNSITLLQTNLSALDSSIAAAEEECEIGELLQEQQIEEIKGRSLPNTPAKMRINLFQSNNNDNNNNPTLFNNNGNSNNTNNNNNNRNSLSTSPDNQLNSFTPSPKLSPAIAGIGLSISNTPLTPLSIDLLGNNSNLTELDADSLTLTEQELEGILQS